MKWHRAGDHQSHASRTGIKCHGRAVPVAPSVAAIENPRLIIALIAVIDAQKINGTVILKSYDVSFWDVTVK